MYRVSIRLLAQDVHGSSELIMRLGQTAPELQGLASEGPRTGSRPGLATLEVVVLGLARLLDGQPPVAIGYGLAGGTLPQHARGQSIRRCLRASRAR